MARIILYSFIVIAFMACSQKQEDLFPIKSIEQIFTDDYPQDKDILVVLTNRGCHACDMLKQTFQENVQLKEKLLDDYLCFEYPADKEGFDFLNRLLYQYSFPVTIIFSRNGDLKALIGGAAVTDELINIKDTLDKEKRFITNLKNRLSISQSDYAILISSTLKAFLNYYSGDCVTAQREILKSMEQHEYFYNLYLGAKITQIMQDSMNSIRYAQKAQLKNSEFDNFLYRNLAEELSYITGNNVKYSENQFAVVFKNKYQDCGKIKMNEECLFEFELKNIDTIPVIIQSVDKACNCMEVDWDRQPILPENNGYVRVWYDTSKQGFFQKILFVNINRDVKPIPLWVKGFIE